MQLWRDFPINCALKKIQVYNSLVIINSGLKGLFLLQLTSELELASVWVADEPFLKQTEDLHRFT